MTGQGRDVAGKSWRGERAWTSRRPRAAGSAPSDGDERLLVRLTHPLREQGAEAPAGAAAHPHLDQGGVAFRLACGTGRAQLHLQVCMLKKLTPALGVVGQPKQSLL